MYRKLHKNSQFILRFSFVSCFDFSDFHFEKIKMFIESKLQNAVDSFGKDQKKVESNFEW